MSVTFVLCQLPKIFFHPQTANDYGYHSLGELVRFTYCLLRNIKQETSLSLVEQWEQNVLANHCKFAPISDEEFLSGTRLLAALNTIGSFCLKKELRREARRFLEESTNSVLSSVAAQSNIGQGLSCLCPAIIIGGDNHAPLHLLGLLLNGLLERERIKGSEIEACRAEYQSLSKSSDNWSGFQRGAALMYVTSCCFALCRLVFLLAGIYLKYVSSPIR